MGVVQDRVNLLICFSLVNKEFIIVKIIIIIIVIIIIIIIIITIIIMFKIYRLAFSFVIKSLPL